MSFDATRAAISRLNAYLRKRPSGLRLPGVSEPWPGSRSIVIVLLVLYLAAHRIPVPHHLFHGNLPGVGVLVDDELYKVRIASHIARVSEDLFKN